jgi:hypothetical protein
LIRAEAMDALAIKELEDVLSRRVPILHPDWSTIQSALQREVAGFKSTAGFSAKSAALKGFPFCPVTTPCDAS